MTVDVQVVTYNNERTIRKCLLSVLDQTYIPHKILVIDNNSTDQTKDIIIENFSHSSLISLRKNTINTGFSRGHNFGINRSRAEFNLVLNPDLFLEKDFLEKMIRIMKQYNNCGSAGGLLYRWDLTNNRKSDIIDSFGMNIYSDLHVSERYSGMPQNLKKPIKKALTKVFGVSAACVLYRKKALEQVKWDQEYYDEDFFYYKEDVDLSWRLWNAGWDSWVDPRAIGYHVRKVSGVQRPTIHSVSQIRASRQSRSKKQRFHSFKNQLCLLVKNCNIGIYLHHFWSIEWYYIKLLLLALLFEPFLFLAYLKFFTLIPTMLRKRSQIMKQSKRSANDFRHWVSHT